MMNEFDLKAKSWDLDPVKAERAKAVADAIREDVPLLASSKVFEYGCGTGLLSFFFQPYVGRIVMADSSKEMLNVLREKIRTAGAENMFPIELDLTSSDAPDERFDLLYTLLTLHHVQETERLLSVFHSMLDPGGHLCIADLDKEDGSFHGAGFIGHRGFDRDELRVQTEAAGFTDVRFRTVFELQRTVDETAKKKFPIFLMTAKKR